VPRSTPNFEQIRNKVRRIIGDPSGGIWNEVELDRNINRAITRVWTDTEWEVSRATFEGVTDQMTYTTGTGASNLPTDMLLIKELIAVDWDNHKLFPTSFIAMDKYDPEWESATGSVPSRYILFSYDTLLMWPPPDANAGNRTIAVQYVPVPQTVTNPSSTTLGAVTSTPPLYVSDLIELKAAALCLLRQDWQKAQLYNQMYKGRLDQALVVLRRPDNTHTVKLRPAGKFGRAHGSIKFKL